MAEYESCLQLSQPYLVQPGQINQVDNRLFFFFPICIYNAQHVCSYKDAREATMRFGWLEVMGLYISMVMWTGKCVRGG